MMKKGYQFKFGELNVLWSNRLLLRNTESYDDGPILVILRKLEKNVLSMSSKDPIVDGSFRMCATEMRQRGLGEMSHISTLEK